ncbi:MAG: hypothetical protein HS126_38225 [Anaerolineales bacterium]|nr:hypothetical protein [Anaerolineales bacterium]
MGDEARLIVLHDPCDIRKEHLGCWKSWAKSETDGNLINGYSTFNSVAVDVTGKKLYPVDLTVYSNRDEHYVTVAELKALAKAKLQQIDPQRAEQIEQFVQEESHLNLPRLSRNQLKQVSQAFKQKNSDIKLCHLRSAI